jgi:hypothetical protein
MNDTPTRGPTLGSRNRLSRSDGFSYFRYATTNGGWTILKRILREIGWDGRDWIELAQDKDQWRALVNTVMNLRVP